MRPVLPTQRHGARHRLARVRRSLRLPFAAALTVIVAASVIPALSADAASTSAPIMFGAAGSSQQMIQQNEKVLGGTLPGARVYRSWGQTVFSKDQIWARDTGHTLFLSIKAVKSGTTLKWADIAAAAPGSVLYKDMQSQAKQIKDFKATVYLAFNHEPEAKSSQAMGDGAQYIAAWRKWVTVLRAEGATNAKFVFTATAYGFARNDSRSVNAYYPGDAYVDDIAADGYNWGTCRKDEGGWRELSSIIEAQRLFGLKHPTKGLMLFEFGSTEDLKVPGRKAQWLRNAQALFKQPAYQQYKAVLTWEGRAYGGQKDCQFDYLSSSSATAAWKAFGQDASYKAAKIG